MSDQTQNGPVLAADGTPLKRSLNRALRRQKLRALMLIAPLLIFVLLTFIAPIADMLFRSVENQIVSNTLPRTVQAMETWDKSASDVPPEEIFEALYYDIFIAVEARRHTRLGQRLNYENTGMSSLFRGSGRDVDDFREADVAAIEDLEPKWEEGLEAGLNAAWAGNRACDIAIALAGPLEKAGIERGARCGYPIGLSYPPDWGERTISLRTEDETVLEPGMTFHFMPGLWMQDWGLEITESILIREDGPAETFCDRPRELFVKT